jgi:RNA polymerase sigma-70 factor (ECF subfamily)
MTENIDEIGIESGNSESFTKFVEEYKNKAYSLSLRILKNPQEAEDSLQESFLKLYKSIREKKFEKKSKMSTYFYTIVYNTALDNYKKTRAKSFNIFSFDVNEAFFKEGDELFRQNDEEKILDEIRLKYHSETPENKLVQKEISDVIKKYLLTIPEHYSVVLNMFYINELSYDEISGILKLPVGTVKNRIFRAKEKLKEIILKKYSLKEVLMYV